MTPEELASQAFQLGPDGMLAMFEALEQILQSEAGVSVQDLVDQMAGGGQQEQADELPMIQPEASTTFGPEDDGMTMAASSGRQRIVMR